MPCGDWIIPHGAPDELAAKDLPTLRRRSADLTRNNPLAAGAISTKVQGVGGTGLKLNAAIDRGLLGLDDEAADAWDPGLILLPDRPGTAPRPARASHRTPAPRQPPEISIPTGHCQLPGTRPPLRRSCDGRGSFAFARCSGSVVRLRQQLEYFEINDEKAPYLPGQAGAHVLGKARGHRRIIGLPYVLLQAHAGEAASAVPRFPS